MSIKLTKHVLFPKDQTLEELEYELRINLDSMVDEFPGFSYDIIVEDNKLIVKSLNLKEYVN